jgi:hypothetical protein
MTSTISFIVRGWSGWICTAPVSQCDTSASPYELSEHRYYPHRGNARQPLFWPLSRILRVGWELILISSSRLSPLSLSSLLTSTLCHLLADPSFAVRAEESLPLSKSSLLCFENVLRPLALWYQLSRMHDMRHLNWDWADLCTMRVVHLLLLVGRGPLAG